MREGACGGRVVWGQCRPVGGVRARAGRHQSLVGPRHPSLATHAHVLALALTIQPGDREPHGQRHPPSRTPITPQLADAGLAALPYQVASMAGLTRLDVSGNALQAGGGGCMGVGGGRGEWWRWAEVRAAYAQARPPTPPPTPPPPPRHPPPPPPPPPRPPPPLPPPPLNRPFPPCWPPACAACGSWRRPATTSPACRLRSRA